MDSAPLEITVQLLSVIPRTVIVHVPLRDATVVVHDTDTDHVVSIHAPLRGATPRLEVLSHFYAAFPNSLPYAVDRQVFCLRSIGQLVIIPVQTPEQLKYGTVTLPQTRSLLIHVAFSIKKIRINQT